MDICCWKLSLCWEYGLIKSKFLPPSKQVSFLHNLQILSVLKFSHENMVVCLSWKWRVPFATGRPIVIRAQNKNIWIIFGIAKSSQISFFNNKPYHATVNLFWDVMMLTTNTDSTITNIQKLLKIFFLFILINSTAMKN